MKELFLTVPMEPPTVNMYVRHTRSGRHYKTKAADDWEFSVNLAAYEAGIFEQLQGKKHEVTYTVYQGYKSKGDVDNYAKCVLDSLVTCGVLKTDASVVSLHCHKLRDRENPRTEIHVKEVA